MKFRPGNVGVGIGGMRQRVEEFGGAIRLSNSNPGTVVEVIIPVQEQTLDRRVGHCMSSRKGIC